MSERPQLKAVREDWERALVVVAHPDDMEFGASASVARWTDQVGAARGRHDADVRSRGESLRAHQAYIDGLGWDLFDPAEFLEAGARAAGRALGCTFASSYEVFSLQWGDVDDD